MTKNKINYVDIIFGLSWGDEGKGKVTSVFSDTKNYDIVARYSGGNNAGHTVYINNKKYKTNLIPTGVFYGIKSIIGPNCVLNIKSFFEEIKYLKDNGFDTSVIKVSPKTHIISEKHIEIDSKSSLGTTGKGIGPCYTDKVKRCGIMAKDCDELKEYLWDEKLYGNILCEGSQGFYLDINKGNYPYVTSCETLPYYACSIGFPPQYIRHIVGCAKIYDTRVGKDPDFPDSLLENEELKLISDLGQEYGVTTGRRRTVNYLNLDKLINSIQVSGSTTLIMSKCDILEKANIYKFFYKNKLEEFKDINIMKEKIESILNKECIHLYNIVFSSSPYTI
jgi:adenylosuccinate synthase